MKSDIEKVYLIDRFLKGELLGPSLDEFRSKLRTDKEFADEVESQRAIIEGIKLARRQHLISILSGEKIPVVPIIKEKIVDEKIVDEKTFSERTVELRNEINQPKVDFEINDTDNNGSGGKEYRSVPNYNNWYFAVAAILLAIFCVYFIFGYYIPHQKLEIASKDSSKIETPENKPVIKEPEMKEPSLVEEPLNNDTVLQESPQIENEPNPLMAQTDDSLPIEKDKKISETRYSVSALETISPVGGEMDGKVSVENPDGTKVIKVKKIKGSSINVEYWQSVVNFKGYKLSGSNLQLYDVKPDEKVNLKYLDKQLYLKRNGNYYKLNSSGNFEQYQKESNPEIIKTLESN